MPSFEGRAILLVNNSFQAGETFGFPLTDGEDRVHSHVISGNFNLPSKEVSALGGSNTEGAHSGKQPLLGFVNVSTQCPSGLPFVQLTACRYNSISFQPEPTLPIGGVSLWDTPVTGCPALSAPMQQTFGRLLAVTNSSGIYTNPGAGSLQPGMDVVHGHDFSVSISLDGFDYDGIHGCKYKGTRFEAEGVHLT